MLFSKVRWWIEVMGIMYVLSLNLPIVLRPKKCINSVEHTRRGNTQTSKMNKSRLPGEENGAGAQVPQESLWWYQLFVAIR